MKEQEPNWRRVLATVIAVLALLVLGVAEALPSHASPPTTGFAKTDDDAWEIQAPRS
jgi:hypothetical protein